MATRYVALLRAVNVGGTGVISMARLREVLASCGYRDIATYLQSGNAVFTCGTRASDARVASDIEKAIREATAVDTRVLLRTREELERVVAGNPLVDVATNPSRLIVVFLDQPPQAEAVRALDADAFAPDRFAIVGREVYVWCPNGVSKTKLTQGFFEKKLGAHAATGRNWNTVRALLELASSPTPR